MIGKRTQQHNNRFLAYVRVSSKDQSRGTSLEQQKSMITQYAHDQHFTIVNFYGEVESASTSGRQIFKDMIVQMQKESLAGIIFHKADRSSRNFKDAAVLYDLMEQGYELHFAENRQSTRDAGGRQWVYLMWALATSYSENLAEEINKGIMGRLKQGRYPGPVPLGFKKGPDCMTLHDPAKAPLVKKMFLEYATGKYSIERLVEWTKKTGLTNKNGRNLSINPVHRMLRDTFYYGLITHVRGTFQGEYEPLISKQLFDKVQFVLKDRGFKIEQKYNYIFQGLLTCYVCSKKLKAMTAKRKWPYYLCRNKQCGIKTISESTLEDQFLEQLKILEFTEEEATSFKKAVLSFRRTADISKAEQIKAMDLELSAIDSRLTELLQKYTDRKIDDETYSHTRKAWLNQQIQLKESRTALEDSDNKSYDQMKELVKLLVSPVNAYKKADLLNRRRLIISMVANLELNGKVLIVNWKKPFELVARRPKSIIGGHCIKKL